MNRRIHRGCAILAWLFLFMLVASTADAARYTCNAASRMSKLGARDTDKVVVTPDEANRECRFSVNGEPAGSPPRGLILNALRVIESRKGSSELRNKNVDWLAPLLLAASRETTVPDDLRSQLLAHATELSACLGAWEAGRAQQFPNFGEGKDVFCRLLNGGGKVGFNVPALDVQLESEVPVVVLGLRRAGEAYFLFLPMSSRT